MENAAQIPRFICQGSNLGLGVFDASSVLAQDLKDGSGELNDAGDTAGDREWISHVFPATFHEPRTADAGASLGSCKAVGSRRRGWDAVSRHLR